MINNHFEEQLISNQFIWPNIERRKENYLLED